MTLRTGEPAACGRLLAWLVVSSLLWSRQAAATTFTVDRTDDVVAATACDDATPGDCSLRGAIITANATHGADIVVVPAGTYTLTIAGAGENAAATGDLDVTDDLTIIGGGAAATIVDGNKLDRVFHVDPNGTGITVDMSDLTVRNGKTVLISFVSGAGAGLLLGTHQTLGTSPVAGHLTLTHVVVDGNTSVTHGGGIANNRGTIVLRDSRVQGNVGLEGGGIVNGDGGTLEIHGSTISGNTSLQDGGGVFSGFFDTASLTLVDSTVSGNTAPGSGGGINRNRGTLAVTNCTIAGNTAGNGGGISGSFAGSAANLIQNSTIVDNHATNGPTPFGTPSGGIQTTAALTLSATILARNTHAGGASDCAGPLTSAGYDLIEAPNPGPLGPCVISGDSTGNILGRDPQLGLLAANGGPTETDAVLAGSPVIDAGPPATPGSGAGACPALDQRGVVRPVGARCDIGAFEFQGGFALAGIRPARGGNTGAVTAFVYGSGFADGASVALRRAGSPDVVGSSSTVAAGGSIIVTTLDLTGAAPGSWDVVVTNTAATTVTHAGTFAVVDAGDTDVWVDLIGPSSFRVGTGATLLVVYGNRGSADALGVPVTLAIPNHFGYQLRFPIAPPPPAAGQILGHWGAVPVGVLIDGDASYSHVPLLLPVVPAGAIGVLQVRIGTSSNPQLGVPFPVYLTFDPPLFTPTLGAGVVDQIVAGAQDYATTVLGVTLPAALVPDLAQYAMGQLDATVTRARNALLDQVGSEPQVVSLSQLAIDVALFGGGRVLANSQASIGYRALAALLARVTLAPRAAAAAGVQCPIIPCDGRILTPGCSCVQCPKGKCSDFPDIPPIPLPPDCPINTGQFGLGDLYTLLTNDKCKPTPEHCLAMPGHRVVRADDGTLLCVPDKNKKECKDFKAPNPARVGNADCLGIPLRETFSRDPNGKDGPLGSGDQQYLLHARPLTYDVHFENEAAATAAAAAVVVTDPLDMAHVDLSTFALGPIQFGDVIVRVPPGLSDFTETLDLRPDRNLLVVVQAGLDQQTGVATWRLRALDPDTLAPPSDPAAGLLPPNVIAPEGEGSVAFTVDPKPDLPAGVTICNQASIVFDVNDPIATPSWCNTLDPAPPISQVDAAEITLCATDVAVRWSGTDLGSGLRDYTIFVSENGAPFGVWQQDTTATGATFMGRFGSTYAFYSVARDNAGNVEAPPPTADATAAVVECPPTTTTSSSTSSTVTSTSSTSSSTSTTSTTSSTTSSSTTSTVDRCTTLVGIPSALCYLDRASGLHACVTDVLPAPVANRLTRLRAKLTSAASTPNARTAARRLRAAGRLATGARKKTLAAENRRPARLSQGCGTALVDLLGRVRAVVQALEP